MKKNQKIDDIVKWSTKIENQNRNAIFQKLKTCTCAELDKIYCQINNVDQSYLFGLKHQKLQQLTVSIMFKKNTQYISE